MHACAACVRCTRAKLPQALACPFGVGVARPHMRAGPPFCRPAALTMWKRSRPGRLASSVRGVMGRSPSFVDVTVVAVQSSKYSFSSCCRLLWQQRGSRAAVSAGRCRVAGSGGGGGNGGLAPHPLLGGGALVLVAQRVGAPQAGRKRHQGHPACTGLPLACREQLQAAPGQSCRAQLAASPAGGRDCAGEAAHGDRLGEVCEMERSCCPQLVQSGVRVREARRVAMRHAGGRPESTRLAPPAAAGRARAEVLGQLGESL